MHPWLEALRHDLVKRAVWPARDLRDASLAPPFGLRPSPAEPAPPERDLAALRRGLMQLTDAEGAPATAEALFERMRRGAPRGLDCRGFAEALSAAVAALDLPWPAPLDAVLALEDAFDALARSLPKEK